MKLLTKAKLKGPDSRLPLLLCFLIPFVSCYLGFTVFAKLFNTNALYPFGNGMILAHDGWHQYFPFLGEFRDKLVSGGSLEYTWTIGMGTGYASLFAYYLASPLNLLSILVPKVFMPEFYAFLTILKLSLAGLFMGIFLKKVYHRNDMSLPFFSLAYALCAWASGYYWNLMWLDVFALLPLLVLGTIALLKEGKYRLYVLILSLTLWSNYYVAYFCCIFVFLCFIGYNLICWDGFKNLLRRFLRIEICTVIAVGIAAVLLLPTLMAMQHTYSATAKEIPPLALKIVKDAYGVTTQGQSMGNLLKTQTLPGLWEGSKQVLQNMLTAPQITKMDGLPNVFCGFSTVILALYYFCCKNVKLREKLFSLFLLVLFLLSFLFRSLDYIWHGFHVPNMLPYRFSFLFSFVLINMAYRAYTRMDRFKKWYLAIILPFVGLLYYNLLGAEELSAIRKYTNLIVPVGMVAFFLLYPVKDGKNLLQRAADRLFSKEGKLRRMVMGFTSDKGRRITAMVLLFAILSCEMGLCYFLGAQVIGFTKRDIYPTKGADVQALLDYAKVNSDDLFYRTEVSATQTLNDGSLNGYYGASVFTSSANVNFNRFSRSLGFSSWPGSNRTSYYEGSPFTNTMSGIRYLLDRDDRHLNHLYNRCIARSNGVNLLECKSYISPGFMANQALGNFVTKKDIADPFAEQEEMFAMATGLDGDGLYQMVPMHHSVAPAGCSSTGSGPTYTFSSQKAVEETAFNVYYEATRYGLYCVSAKSFDTKYIKEVSVYRNGKFLCTRNLAARSLFTIGEFEDGDEIRLEFKAQPGKTGQISATVQWFNSRLYDEGYALLADEPWQLTEFSDAHIVGTVQVKQAGLFYTSIPYENGWTVKVDGKPIKIATSYNSLSEDVKLTDAVIAFPLNAGDHTVELTYQTPGLAIGAAVSVVSLLTFVALLWICGKQLLPEAPKEPEEPQEPEPPEETEEPEE